VITSGNFSPILGHGIALGFLDPAIAVGAALTQRLTVTPGSRLADVFGSTQIEVNTMHHQAVKGVAPSLRVSGRAEDGVIEALESVDHRFLLAVQWHPEEITDLPWVQRLFLGFAQAATPSTR